MAKLLRTRLRQAAAACGLALGAASVSVSAATIGINGGVLTAFATEADDVLVIAANGAALDFLGVGFDIVTPGCIGTGTVTCATAGLTELRIDMLGGDDVLELSGLPAIAGLAITARLGAGNDIFIGGPAGERVFGGPDDDVLLGAGGTNGLSGGSGDNVVLDSQFDPGPDLPFPPARPVPEPAAAGLLLLGLAGLAGLRRRRSA